MVWPGEVWCRVEDEWPGELYFCPHIHPPTEEAEGFPWIVASF